MHSTGCSPRCAWLTRDGSSARRSNSSCRVRIVIDVCSLAPTRSLARATLRPFARSPGTQRCDTTYIHPEYITVPTPHFDAYEYSLVRYREKPSAWVPTAVTQRRGRAAVLFVHGHLGSYEQMRSMASESAKEISRRIKSSAGASADADADAVDWFGADFLEEPSGLEPRLLERQAAYVAACVEYLSTSYDKVVLLGYSMGGLVVDRVLATDKAVSDKVGMAITIGSPHFHLPTLVIPTPEIGRAASSPRPPPRIPTLRVFSGPGDLMVPSISAWSVHARALASNDGEDAPSFEVDLENVPGVWCVLSQYSSAAARSLHAQTRSHSRYALLASRFARSPGGQRLIRDWSLAISWCAGSCR